MRSMHQSTAAAGLAVLALAGAVGVAGATTQSGGGATRPASHERAGRAEAPFATRAESLRRGRKLLAEAVLPAGTHRFHGRKLPAELRQPPEESSANSIVDVYRVFAEGRSMRRTFAFLNHHHPAGWYNDGTGQGSIWNVITEEHVDYLPRHIGAAFNEIEMLVNVVPGHHGHALVRVDVQVTWYPRRPAAEYLVARDFRAVRIERQFEGANPVWRTFRQRGIIDKLTRVLNLEPGSPGGTWSCPNGGNYYQLTFKPVKGKPGAVVMSDGCPPIYFISIGHHSQPGLVDDGKIETIVDHLLRGSHQPTR
jgi:hypothetical protein